MRYADYSVLLQIILDFWQTAFAEDSMICRDGYRSYIQALKDYDHEQLEFKRFEISCLNLLLKSVFQAMAAIRERIPPLLQPGNYGLRRDPGETGGGRRTRGAA